MSGSYDKASFGPLLMGAKAAYRDAGLTITPTAMIAEGDKVAVEAEGFATLTDGRSFTPHYHFLITVRGAGTAGPRSSSAREFAARRGIGGRLTP